MLPKIKLFPEIFQVIPETLKCMFAVATVRRGAS
jgi:hypothetical protein